MSSTYLSPFLNFYKHVHVIIASYQQMLALSVSEKLVYHFRILALHLSALLVGLLLQLTLYTSVCFMSCNRSDPGVILAGKLHSRTEIVANTGTHLEKNQAFEEQWNLFCHLHCYSTQGRETSITATAS